MLTTFDDRPSTRLFSCSRLLFTAAVAAALVAYGCGGSSDDKNASGGTSSGSGATGGTSVGDGGLTGGTGGGETLPPPDAIGTFAVNLVPQSSTGTPAYADVRGAVRVLPLPPAKGAIWTVTATDGGCKLVKPTIPFCATDCANAEVCIPDGTCRALDPTHVSVGTVTVEGVATPSGTTVTMNPTSTNNYVALAAAVTYPPFVEGASVHLAAAGAGDYGQFTIDAKGIPTLAMGNSTTTLAPNQPINLAWTGATVSGNSRILVTVDISQHGTTRGLIVCDVDDNGSLTIPASLATALIDLGVAGWPTIGITRQAKGRTTVLAQGPVELLVVSSVELEVAVQGYTSCNAENPCPNGATCGADLLCPSG
jgi:hypothetical protein